MFEQYYFLISKILFVLVVLLGIWLALWVYLSNKKRRESILFVFMTFFIISWVTCGYFANIEKEYSLSLFYTKIAAASALLLLIAAFFFIIYFVKQERISNLITAIVLFLGLANVGVTIFTNWFFEGMQSTGFGFLPILGRVWYFYNSYALFMGVLIGFMALKKYFRLPRGEKLKIQYFLVGFFIFILMNIIVNTILPLFYRSYQYYQFGNYSAIFLLSLTAYAIVKRELFGIKVVLTALLVSLIAILLLVDIFILTQEPSTQLFKGLLLLIFLYFGYLLIRSVLKEIALRVELEKAYKELKKLDVAKSEFISIASHQLRTPLTAIKGYISLINEKIYGKPPKGMNKPLKNIYISTERLIKLVSDLLNISRIEAGKIKLEIEKFPLEDIIDSVVDELRNLAKEKKLYLKWERPKKSLPKVLVDKDRIRQVILNIVDNGIRYTERGGVTIRYRKGNKMCKLIVSDTGEGMTKKEILNLFKSFTRGALGQRTWTEGTGLGLYIAKKFVDIHNGRIWAKSPGRGKGSTFYIELPIA